MISLAALAGIWPTPRSGGGVPLICLTGSGAFTIIPLALTAVAWEEAEGTPLGAPSGEATVNGSTEPLGIGLIGLISYDQFAHPLGPGVTGAPPRIFQVERALVVNHRTGVPAIRSSGRSAQWALSPEIESAVVRALKRVDGALPSPPPLGLRPAESTASYLSKVARVLEDIHAGRYYQLNLLRYFTVDPAPELAWLLARLDAVGGTFSALAILDDLELCSFSPERFVAVDPDLKCEARPIKGTAARDLSDQGRDLAAAAALVTSVKDLAELHMIVDLMRNDLARISLPGTVSVAEANALVTTPTVHHLEARVCSRLPAGLTLGALLAALCPGGSITGAPKIEVRSAIAALEGRSRGYFMGHAFYLDAAGRFDSSILIRTLVRWGDHPWEYAAGSGLVVGSDPALEAAEIDAKCSVVAASYY